MIIAVTGPARRLWANEVIYINTILRAELRPCDILLSGGALGVDTVAAVAARRLGCKVVLVVPATLSWNKGLLDLLPDAEVYRVQGSYMHRNDELARRADRVVAFPNQADEIVRSGTWATVRRFRKAGKGVLKAPLSNIKMEGKL